MLTSPRGTVDILPGDVELFQRMEDAARRIFTAYDYSEIRTPILEDTALFVRGIGETTDIVSKEMYTFETRGGQSVTLRPEGTAGVARAVIQHSLIKQTPLLKVYYIGPMFRYARPQAGRQRQFHQIGMEFFGVSSPEADAEVIAVMTRLLEALGFRGVRTRVNTLGAPEERQRYSAMLRDFLAARADRLDPDSRARLERNPLRILDSKDPATQELLAEAPSIHDALGPESLRRFDLTLERLADMKIELEVTPRLVRGLDYYSHTVFDTTLPGLGAQDAVLGGGRYDGLITDLGGDPTPGAGAALGMERLALALRAAGLADVQAARRPDVYLITPDEAGLREASRLCDLWRSAGVRVRWDSAPRSFKPGMKAASRCGARYAALLGENERASGQIALKNLATGEQSLHTPEEALALLQRPPDSGN